MSAVQVPAGRGEPVTMRLPDEIDIDCALGAELDLLAALWSGTAVVIADLTGTIFCDVAGARMLAGAHCAAIAGGGELRIAASPRVRYYLAVTRLAAALPVYPTLSAAMTDRSQG